MQVATLYPTTWLGIVLAPERAIPAALVAHLAGGALGAALFFRHAGAHLPAAAMGSLVYTFACVLGLSFWPPSLVTVAWMPWMLLFAEMLLTSFRWRIWLSLIGVTALQLLAGFPQFALYGGQLAGLYVLLRLAEQRHDGVAWSTLAMRAGALLAAVMLGVGLAGVQLLPTAELARESLRTARLPASQLQYRIGERTLSPGEFVGNAVDPSPKLVSPGYGRGTGYVGALPLVMAAVGAGFGRRRGRRAFWLGMGLLTALLSFGPTGPWPWLFDAFAATPGGAAARIAGTRWAIRDAARAEHHDARGLRSRSRRPCARH